MGPTKEGSLNSGNLRVHSKEITLRGQIVEFSGAADSVKNACAILDIPPDKHYRFDCQFLLKDYFD